MTRRNPQHAPRLLLPLAVLALGCAEPAADSVAAKPAVRREEPAGVPALGSRPARATLDGRAFPDKVIALTWDDGPDADTFALAEYLSSENVSATFFVVDDWVDHVSSDPGWGSNVFETGYTHLPLLADLVELGHRLGNHTQNHVILTDAEPGTVLDQLRANQHKLDPFLTNELRLFRAPGGAWNGATGTAIDADPYLAQLSGPVRWDVDRKDWENSVYCRSSRPAAECEREGPERRLRVKPAVTAERYLAAIEEAGHGIVLLHDRVGHVGSGYALRIARKLVPQLKARGFVFAAPVLQFSPLVPRAESANESAALRLADVDGDGRADVCEPGLLGVACARSAAETGSIEGRLPRAVFRDARFWDRAFTAAAGWSLAPYRDSIRLADVDGDGRADLCARGPEGIECAVAERRGAFGMVQGWSSSHWLRPGEPVADFSDDEGWSNDAAYYDTIRFGDVDGDGKADVCGRSPGGIVCARSRGNGFDPARRWLADLGDAEGWTPVQYSATIQLADVDGDGRADLCGRGKNGIVCARSSGGHFGEARKWSAGTDFSDADKCPWPSSAGYYGTIRFADINGDGRADVCGRTAEGVVCALSTGRSFTRATLWLRGMTDGEGWAAPRYSASIELADVNGDGRADICGRGGDGIVCGLAP